MNVVIHKGWRGMDGRRYRVAYKAVDEDTGDVLACNEASFASEPDQSTEDGVFAGLLSRITAGHLARLNACNRKMLSSFQDEWRQVKLSLLQWIANHPSATAGQALTAFETAYPDSVFEPIALFALMQTVYGFGSWAQLRDYVVANIASVEEED